LALSATVFEILTLKGRKSLNFPDPLYFEAPVRGDPLEFGNEIWRQKTRVLALPDGEEIMPLAFFVLTQYRRVTDGQTDGRTDVHRAVKTLVPYVPNMWIAHYWLQAVAARWAATLQLD